MVWQYLKRGRRHDKARRHSKQLKKARLGVETLEDRTTPTIVFTPQMGSPTISDGGGDGLPNARVHLIFWGSAWGSSTSPSIAAVENATRALIDSAYFDALAQYRFGLQDQIFVQSAWDTSDPPNNFSLDDVQSVVESIIDNNFADPDDIHNPIYLVVTPPGINSFLPNTAGFEHEFTYHDSFLDWDHVPYAWVGNGGSLDSVMSTLSHELVGAIASYDNGIGHEGLVDGEAQNFTHRVNGVLALSYWSVAHNAFVVPDGTSQRFVVNNGALIVNGDQLDNDSDTITIDASGGGVRVTLNGEVAQFEPGAITSITVNAGAALDVINVERIVSNVPVTVNPGGGTNFVHVSPSARNLDNLGSSLTINGQGGSDTLNVNDQNNTHSDTWDIRTSSISRSFASAINYFNIDGITVRGGSGANLTYNVAGTAFGTPLTLFAGSNGSVVNVSPLNTSLGRSQNLDDLDANLSIIGEGGTDLVVIHDQSNVFSDTFTITSGSVGRNASSPISYGGVEGLTVHGGSGTSLRYNVQSTLTTTPVTINAGSGNNTINVTPLDTTFPRSQNLDDLDGSLIINGQGGTDTLVLHDQGNIFSDTFTITSTTATRNAAALITYGTLEGLTVHGGSGAALSYTVRSTAFTTPVTINAGSGNNTINVTPEDATTTRLEHLDDLDGALTINGQGGTDTLVLHDQSSAFSDTFTITSTTATRNAAALITYGTLEGLTVHGGSGTALSYNVQSTGATTPVTINAGNGNNIINVGSTTNSLSTILGGVTVNGQGGTDTLNVRDQGNTLLARTWALTSSSLSPSGAAALTYGTLENLVITAGGAADTLNISSTSATTAVSFNGGVGADRVIGVNLANTWALSGAGIGSVGVVSFTDVQQLTGGTGADRFRFLVGGSVAGQVDGGLGIDTLDYAALSTAVAVNLQSLTASGTGGIAGIEAMAGGSSAADSLVGSNAATTWRITANNAGTLNLVAFSFSGVEGLTGGSSNDEFLFSRGVGVSGTINGGLGTNTLNYASWTTGVTVNLTAGTSQAVGGGVSNFQNVLGGSGNDTLTGSAVSNVLMGNAGNDTLSGGAGGNDVLVGGNDNDTLTAGPGRSLLIGGRGRDVLTGGGADDLLIAGHTNHDALTPALLAIMSEWSRTDVSDQVRIDHLRGTLSGGLNGANVLQLGVTVFDDTPADELRGNAGFDWFWATPGSDVLRDQPERLN